MENNQDTLAKAHLAEMESREADPTNFGWATGEDFIHSKTTKGKLYSEIDANGKITHEWTEVL